MFLTGRHTVAARFAVGLACLYAPFAWVLLIDYPWNSYRIMWLLWGPLLPGFWIHATSLHRAPAWATAAAMGLVTLVAVAGLALAARRNWYWTAAAGALALLYAAFNSAFALAAFWV